jgi:recombination protein RecR
MSILPDPIQDLINAFERLPGIGPKSASRLAFYLLRAPEEISLQLAESLLAIGSSTDLCQICFNITLAGQEMCELCANPERDINCICVVEDPSDVLALERTGGYHGRYHVLHGVLSPIEGVGIDDLQIKSLVNRVKNNEISEVIIATNPSMEGDATALYLNKQLAQFDVRVTRLARGLPMGGDLEYADQNTILRALAGRQELD